MRMVNVWIEGSLLCSQVPRCSPGKLQSWANCSRSCVAKPKGLELDIESS